MVLVQDPITAMHEGMPRAAIANGAADHIMPIGAIAQELIACGSPDYVRASTATWAEDVQETLDGIINLIRTKAGFDFAGYKATPLLWRIQRRMELR
jgi:two-component system CheB/CheR fusion protein